MGGNGVSQAKDGTGVVGVQNTVEDDINGVSLDFSEFFRSGLFDSELFGVKAHCRCILANGKGEVKKDVNFDNPIGVSKFTSVYYCKK